MKNRTSAATRLSRQYAKYRPVFLSRSDNECPTPLFWCWQQAATFTDALYCTRKAMQKGGWSSRERWPRPGGFTRSKINNSGFQSLEAGSQSSMTIDFYWMIKEIAFKVRPWAFMKIRTLHRRSEDKSRLVGQRAELTFATVAPTAPGFAMIPSLHHGIAIVFIPPCFGAEITPAA